MQRMIPSSRIASQSVKGHKTSSSIYLLRSSFGSIEATLAQKVQARIKRLITIAGRAARAPGRWVGGCMGKPDGRARAGGTGGGPKRAAAAPPVRYEYILEWRRHSNSAAATQLSHGQERLCQVCEGGKMKCGDRNKICIRSAKISFEL